MITECRGLKYMDRLVETGLTSLEDRRTRGDLIEVFQMITGKNTVDYRSFFRLDTGNRTRGHTYKLTKNRSRLNIRKNCFSQRTVNGWNGLPESVVGAE